MSNSVQVNNPESAEISGLGNWLRICRSAKGVTLEQAAEVTRISRIYIDALEKEDFAKLPGPAYCKGFTRIYASYLGIPPEEALARYELLVNPRDHADVIPVSPAITSEYTDPKPSYQRWILPLLLLAAVIMLSIFFETDTRTPLNLPNSTPAVVKAPVLPILPPRSSVRPASQIPVQTALSTTRKVLETPAAQQAIPDLEQGGVILKLKINQDSWLNVEIDGLFSKQYDLKAGDIIEWKAERVITLDVGNAGGVEGELNGRPLPPFGPSGENAHSVLRR